MSGYFDQGGFRFLRALSRNNHREWFLAHKAEYEATLRAPFLRLIGDLQPDLQAISPHYRADPRPTGGSLFRQHRDTRFSSDKTPYKTWAGARFFHARSRETEAPAFYLHVQPGHCFIGAGLWHPRPDTQRRLRQFIHDNPTGWKHVTRVSPFRRRYGLQGESLQRMPRGYPPAHELADDLKRKDFVATATLADATLLGPRLRQSVAAHLAGLAPFVDYLCAGLDLEF